MRTAATTVAVVAALILAAGAGAPAAFADGDPASDVLAGQNVYYPVHPEVSGVRRQELNALLRRVRADGLQVKVALIASAADLGTQTKRFDKPRNYAELLGVELEVAAVHDYALVAMPAGLGTYRYDEHGLPVLRKAIAGIPGPGVADADALARSAGKAVVAMAAATGHPVPAALAAPFADRPAAGPGSGHAVRIVVLGLVWLALMGTALRLRWRATGPGRSGSGDGAARVRRAAA